MIVLVEELNIPRIPTNFVSKWIRTKRSTEQTGGELSTNPSDFRDAYKHLLIYFSGARSDS